jgi:hypothetical protein
MYKYVVILLVFAACTSRHITKTEAMQNLISDTTALTAQDTLPLIVQFYSIGEGISTSSQTKLDDFISIQSNKYKVQIQAITVPWGREGEYDACFRLSALNKTQREQLVKDISGVFNTTSRVHIITNQPCQFIK